MYNHNLLRNLFSLYLNKRYEYVPVVSNNFEAGTKPATLHTRHRKVEQFLRRPRGPFHKGEHSRSDPRLGTLPAHRKRRRPLQAVRPEPAGYQEQ